MSWTDRLTGTHVVLVSAQPTPNLLPALDRRTRPQRIALMVSPDMQARAAWLESLYHARRIATERLSIDDAWDVAHIQDRLLDWMARHEGDRPALNLTGGTKLMAIAAQAAFAAEGLPMFYVHPEKNQIVPLFEGEAPPFTLEERIDIREYLAAHGVTEVSRAATDVPTSWIDYAERLIADIERHSDALALLNRLAAKAEGAAGLAARWEHPLKGGAWHALRDLIEESDLASFEPDRMRFPNEAARAFVAGGWLEYLLHRRLAALSGELGIQDLALNLRVERGQRVRNELDIAFLAHNRLYIIECKTRRFPGQDDEDAPAADALYKLDTLRDVGGLNTRGLLASFRRLGHYDRQRASDLHIRTIEAGELRNLRDHLRRWVTVP